MLTKGLDNVPGTSGNDTIIGSIDDNNAELNTMSTLDVVNGGAGVDTLKVAFNATKAAAIALPNLSNVEIIEVQATQNFTLNTSTTAGVTDLNVTKATGTAGLTASDAQNISVAGGAGTITIDGGKNVVVNDATANTDITIGATTGAAGTITVTDTKQFDGVIAVDGGTDVTITATTDAIAAVTGGKIDVGQDASAIAPTGAVTITQNLNSDGVGGDLAGGAITVTGGKTVAVTVNANSTATKAGSNNDITIGTTTVTGDSKTTDVTVTQNASVTTFTTPTVAAVADQTVVTFKAMTAGQTAVVGGLTFTASKALTAEQVAAAFANLTAADTQSATGPTANGIFSGSLAAGYTSGAVSGATVTFTAAAATGDTLALAGTALPTKVHTAGSAASGGATTSNTVTLGDVVVDDHATTAAIKTITLNGFKDATLGGGGSLDALTTLNLSNSAGDTTLTSTSKTLAVTLNDIDGGDVNLGANVETLTLTTTGAASDIDLTATGVKSLTIDAGVGLDLQAAFDYDNVLETVTIKGAGAVDLGAAIASTALKSFSAADNTGGVTVSVSAKTTDVHSTFTKYVLSQGNDNVTLTDVAVNKAIELGAGDDTITLAAGTTTLAANIDGGTGSNTLVMAAADAETASADATFEGKISNFQRLTIGNAASQEVIDLANLDDISYVTLGSSAGTKQVVNVTPGTIESGDIFKITVNGTEYSFTATGATAQNVVEGLQPLVNAHPLVVATEDDAKVILTATTAGVPFSVTSSATKKSGGTDDQTLVTAEATPNAYGITLNNMANAGTVVLTNMGTVSVGMKDASGGSDSLNIVTSVAAGDVTHGYITVAGVETINITATDTNVDEDGDGTTYESGDRDGSTLVLTADAATTVNVTGNANQNLTLLGSDLVELVDASTLEGSLTFTASLADLVVKGGTGADVLTANADDVKLYGNGGGDTLKVDGGLRVNLYGGDGADTFEINASTSLDAYTVINGVDSGDVIMLNGANKFSAAKIALSLGADETLLNYANQAIKTLAEGEMGWFQRGGNTYIVQDVTSSGTNSDAFTAGEDMIVMIVGLVDLGTASYNSTINALEIA